MDYIDMPEVVTMWHNFSTGSHYYSIVLPSCKDGESHENPYILHIKNPDQDDSVLYLVLPKNSIMNLPPLHKMSEEELFQEGLVAEYERIPYDYMLRLVNTIMKNYKSCTFNTRKSVQVEKLEIQI